MSKYYEAVKRAAEAGKMEAGNGLVGSAFRFGREHPDDPRPRWTGAPSSFASAAWRAGRDAGLAERGAVIELSNTGEAK